MNVLLTDEATHALREFVFGVVMEEVAHAVGELGLAIGIKNQKEIADYFQVSTTTIREWEKKGMPFGSMGAKSKFYDVVECRRWVLSQRR